MKKSYFFWGIIIIILVVAAVLAFNSRQKNPSLFPSSSNRPFFPSDPTSVKASEIIVNHPLANEVVKSPLIISGQAKGTWFFEASMPIKLEDVSGQLIASSYAQAQSDWMTDQLVPFKATLYFFTNASSGYLVISKDNPSGLPQNDASIKIPVNF